MPLSVVGLSALRTALVEDIVQAWGCQRVYTSAPELETPTEAGNLPVAALILEPSRFDSATSGPGCRTLQALFSIIGRFSKDEDIDLALTKENRLQELLDLLTADSARYHGAAYFGSEVEINFSPDTSDAARSFFEVGIAFPLHL